MNYATGWVVVLCLAVAVNAWAWSAHRHLNRYALVITMIVLILKLVGDYAASPGGMARKARTLQAEKERPYVRGRFDFLGFIWFAAIPIAPLLGMIATDTVGVDRSNWMTLLGVRVFLTIVVPLVCVLPLLRFVRGPNLVPILIVLVVGTVFPVATGLGSAFDLARGPVWE